MHQFGDKRIAVVGNSTYFANHFPEGWRKTSNVRVFDANENDYGFLMSVINFRPDLTIFFRPELYPAEFVRQISGRKISFLSEPVPFLKNGRLQQSSETITRLSVYAGMVWSAYDLNYYYDEGKKSTIEFLKWPIAGYKQLPIDTLAFRPATKQRPIDICFIGKATPRRIQILDTLRYNKLKFVWVAHGVIGSDLAHLFKRSKIVLNIHADGLPAFEPRVLLGAACGCVVLTEELGHCPEDLRERISVFNPPLHQHVIDHALSVYEQKADSWRNEGALLQYSMNRFIAQQLAKQSVDNC